MWRAMFGPYDAGVSGVGIVFGQGGEEGYESRDVARAQGHILELRWGVAQQGLARELRAVDVEVDDIVESQRAAVVEVRSGIFQVAQRRSFDLCVGCGQALRPRAILNI